MARDPKERSDLTELIRRIESSRSELGGQIAQLKRSLDVPSRMKHSVARQPLAWFGGSLGVGLLTSRIFRGKPRKVRKRGMTTLLFSTILALLKPAIKGFVLSELQRRFKNHNSGKNPGAETHLPLPK